jgi:hypothetical protein
MPIRARINGTDVHSVDYSTEDWEILKNRLAKKKDTAVLPCCGSECYLRTSKNKFKHFVHSTKSASCAAKAETADHIQAKAEILKACHKMGWDAICEFSEGEWRADVLATKGLKRIAFEVQLSYQSKEELTLRQERYMASNVRGCWFIATPKKNPSYFPNANFEIPAFKIFRHEDKSLQIDLDGTSFPLFEFIIHPLSRRIRFCKYYSWSYPHIIKVTFIEFYCKNCGSKQHIGQCKNTLRSVCGKSVSNEDFTIAENRSKMSQQIIRRASALSEKEITLSTLSNKEKYKCAESEYSYYCSHCNVPIGEYWINLLSDPNSNFERIEVEFHREDLQEKTYFPHWCFSKHKNFCC